MKHQALFGKVLWITGASSGIGEALALEAGRRGALLILSGCDGQALKTLATRCAPERTAILSFDLTDKAERNNAAERAEQFFGRIDGLILNAGISQRSGFMNTSPEVFDLILETNFKAAVDLTRTSLPGMLARGSGFIACVSSAAGLMGAPWRTAYSASKHALGGFFSSLRTELSGKGILIAMVYPGFVRTNISLNALEGDGRKHGTIDPLQKSGQDPAKTATIILDGIEAGKLEIKVAFDAKAHLGLFFSRHFPALFTAAIARHGGL